MQLQFVVSRKVSANSPMICSTTHFYNPFLFDENSPNQPVEFELYFIHNQNKYRYYISFNGHSIIEEQLNSYPNKRKSNIFSRPFSISKEDDNIHIGKLGNKMYEIHKKLPLLSIFGKAENYHKELSIIYTYFKNIEIWNILDTMKMSFLKDDIADEMNKLENAYIKNRLDKLIKIADTKIEGIFFGNRREVLEKDDNIRKKRLKILAQHNIHNMNKEKIGEYNLPLQEESSGTNMLFALGGLILTALAKGQIIIFDEIDTSLHPRLSRFLIYLFHHPISNPKNAQLIFTTHEANILDKNNMRADQIWFADKNEFGETEIYSAQDFDGIREDIPFEKWYLAGKFGAVPHIQELEFIFGQDEKK